MKYSHISLEEREEIFALINQGKSFREIGKLLSRSHSTISREINRCGGKSNYTPSRAERHAESQNSSKGRKRLIDSKPEVLMESLKRLFENFSPEQISLSIERDFLEDPWMRISHETIYRYIYAMPKGELKKVLVSHLRRKRKLRKDRKGSHERRGRIIDATSISERPQDVENRRVPGHWEGDLIIGKNHKSALGTLVERTTRMVFLVRVKAKKADLVREAFTDVFQELDPDLRKSLTYDRGHEMAEHKYFTEATGMPVYFCDPSSPWQRGTNENTNGLLRQYFPKGTDFNKVSDDELKRVQDQLNRRPRKVLNWESPHEAFSKLINLKTGAL
jgi:IS30 family transposase